MASPAIDMRLRAESDPRRGFASHTEFLRAVIKAGHAHSVDQVRDERLRMLVAKDRPDGRNFGEVGFFLPRAFNPGAIRAAAGSDEQGTYSDTYGGFFSGTSLVTLGLTTFEGDPTAGRTLVVPMDQRTFKITARSDKDHGTSVSGGLTFTRTPETVAPSSVRAEMEQVVLEASSLVGLAYGTEGLVQDNPAGFAAIVGGGFQLAYSNTMLREKIRGLGGTEYLGVMNSPARISVAKETGQAADTIVSQNVLKMAARCWGLSGAIWLANHDTRAQIYGLAHPVGTGAIPLYQPPRAQGEPGMLLDAPLYFCEHCSTLGDEGDLILVNWSQYLDGIYQPLKADESIHVRFVNHERAFRFWVQNNGAPWWRSAVTPPEGASTISPIVTLAARA